VITPTKQNKGEYLLVGDNTNKGQIFTCWW